MRVLVVDLIFLDLGLPGRDGLEVMTAIRRKHIAVPIIVLTARDTVAERVSGLDAGADDYLIKPFAFAELLARMRVLLRRGRALDPRDITVGPICLDVIARRVTHAGQPIESAGSASCCERVSRSHPGADTSFMLMKGPR